MIGSDDKSLGALIHDVAHLLRKLIDRRVEQYDLTRAKWVALAILDRKEGLTQSELSEEMELGDAAVGRLVDRLAKQGFVDRCSDPEDRRIWRLYIKESARPKLTELENIAAEVRGVALSGINESEQKKLLQTLGKIKTNLQSGLKSAFLTHFTVLSEIESCFVCAIL